MHLKSLFLIWLFLSVHSIVLGQNKSLDQLNKRAEPGKVFVICNMTHDQRPYTFVEETVLKLTAPQWEIVKDTLFADTTKMDDAFRTEIKEATIKWIHYKKLDRNCLSADPKKSLGLALVEHPGQFKTYTHKAIYPFKIIDKWKLKQPGEVTLSDRKFESIQFGLNEVVKVFENKEEDILYFKLKAGHWTEWRELLCSGPGRSGFSIRMIQEALQSRGYYRGKIDNIINENLKKATVRFQKDNKLPVGNFNIETLKHLGVIK